MCISLFYSLSVWIEDCNASGLLIQRAKVYIKFLPSGLSNSAGGLTDPLPFPFLMFYPHTPWTASRCFLLVFSPSGPRPLTSLGFTDPHRVKNSLSSQPCLVSSNLSEWGKRTDEIWTALSPWLIKSSLPPKAPCNTGGNNGWFTRIAAKPSYICPVLSRVLINQLIFLDLLYLLLFNSKCTVQGNITLSNKKTAYWASTQHYY